MSDHSPSLDIAVVNWNTGPVLRETLDSISRAGRDGVGSVRVVVVDNASSDGSSDSLPEGVELIANRENRGFAAACNQAVAASSADYLLFLNPDTRLKPNSLSGAVSFMEGPRGEGIGVCGVRLLDERGGLMPSCARFPSLSRQLFEATGLSSLLPSVFKPRIMREVECERDRVVDHVSGAFFLIRRTLFESLGGFDERFFLYYEEIDLALRARDAGWPSFYLADVEAHHLGPRSSGQVKGARLFYLLRSRTQFIHKHYGAVRGFLHATLTATVELVSRLLYSLRASGSSTGPRDVLFGYRQYLRYLLSPGRDPSSPVRVVSR